MTLAAAIRLVGCYPAPVPQKPSPSIPPQRIVSLAPAITEILFAIGCGDRVVGVTSFCRYPPEAAALPAVGGFYDTNCELIYSLRPDLTLLTAEHEQVAQKLRALNISCQAVSLLALPEIFEAIRSIGGWCGQPSAAEKLVCLMQAEMDKIRQCIPLQAPELSVLVCVGRNLSAGGIAEVYVAGAGTMYDEMLAMLGARNVYQGRLRYAQLGQEGVLRLNPDVIVELAPEISRYGRTAAQLQADWRQLAGVSAVANSRVCVLTNDYICIPGPRVTRILEDFAKAIYAVDLP